MNQSRLTELCTLHKLIMDKTININKLGTDVVTDLEQHVYECMKSWVEVNVDPDQVEYVDYHSIMEELSKRVTIAFN